MTPLRDAHDNIGAMVHDAGQRSAVIGYHDYAKDPSILPEGHPHRSSLNYDYFLPGHELWLDHELDSPEWFEFLRKAGYPEGLLRRSAIHATQLPPEGQGRHLALHFPAHYRAEHSDTRFLVNTAIERIEDADDGWYLSLNFLKPHGPEICPAPYHEMYDPEDMPQPVCRPEELSTPHDYFRRFGHDENHLYLRDWAVKEYRACYGGMISELDASLGVLFQALKDTGLWDNTLIIFSSDHGSHLGDHYLVGKSHFYDAGMRVPYIIRDPSPEADATRGTILDRFCESIDTAPTICDYLGVPPSTRFQGYSLLPQVRDLPSARIRDCIHYEYYYYPCVRSHSIEDPNSCRIWVIRDDHFKYVQPGEPGIEPLLFDLQADPGEFHNLAIQPEYASVVASYCQRLIQWRIGTEDMRMEEWARQYK
jgi:arylsulfatase A-like enzyme